MRLLITGGAGFIGSHLAEHLLAEGHEVYVIDDLSTGQFVNISHLKGREHFHYTLDSIMNVPLMAELVDLCDVVFHAAAAVGVRLIVESPVKTIETNIRGTEIILDLASKKKKRVILFSTSEVYGKNAKIPFHEEDDLVLGPTTKGRWSYACSKAIDEFLGLAYFREKRLPVTVVRLFNTVGPRQTGRYGMVIPTFVRQAISGQPITVFGDGRQSRCFCHVTDVVHALSTIFPLESAEGRVFNIGNDEEVRILDLAEKIRNAVDSRSSIELVPYAEAYEEGFEDMQRRVPNLERIRSLIGYEPRFDLNAIIESVIRFCQETDAAKSAQR